MVFEFFLITQNGIFKKKLVPQGFYFDFFAKQNKFAKKQEKLSLKEKNISGANGINRKFLLFSEYYMIGTTNSPKP